LDSGLKSDSGRDSGSGGETGDSGVEVASESVGTPWAWERPPVLFIDTDGQSIEEDWKVAGTLEIVVDHDGSLDDLSTAARAFVSDIGIEIRGKSSTGFPKKNYGLETRGPDGEDWNVALLGMPDEADWVLHGPYSDKTYMRNAFAYALGRQMGGDEPGRWQPDSVFTEVFVNDQYVGIYVFTEKIKKDPDRVDIEAPAETSDSGDLTGGYIVKREDSGEADSWSTEAGTVLDHHYPSTNDISVEQQAYIKGYLDAFETMMVGLEATHPHDGYRAWVDLDSWIDVLLINELSKNVDGYRKSAYMIKHSDEADNDLAGRLQMGPMWDFNITFGNANYCEGGSTSGWVVTAKASCADLQAIPFWWQVMWDDDDFRSDVRERWEAHRAGPLADEEMTALLVEWADWLAEAEARDHATWGTLGNYVWPNVFVGKTYEEELEYMTTFVVERAAWMDAHL